MKAGRLELAGKIVEKELSVRQVEEMVRIAGKPKKTS